MHLEPAAQLEAKRRSLEEALAREASLASLAVPRVVPAEPTLGYRSRVKWVALDGRLGMYGRSGGHRVVDTPRCLVVVPSLLPIADAIRRALPRLPIEAVDLREARDHDARGVLVTLVTSRSRERRAFVDFAHALVASFPEIAGVALNVRPKKSPQILGSETSLLVGTTRHRDRLDRAHVLATFGAFVQAHRGQAQAIVESIAEHVIGHRREPRVLELFGGAGAIGLELAARGATVELVEAFEPAAQLAREAAVEQGLALHAHAGDAEAFVVDAVQRRAVYDAVVVDPPRRGLSPNLRRAVAELGPRVIAYVSCHAPTLARDLAHLATLGWRVVSLFAFDMIPQTDEVESLALLAPEPLSALECAWRGPEGVVIDAPPHLSFDELAARIAHADGTDFVTSEPHGYSSGATWLAAKGTRARPLRSEALVLAKGITSASGQLDGSQVRRVAALGEHSLVEIETSRPLREALDALARSGHPVIGGARCDAATNRHFVEKHGLDRAFVHVTRLVAPDGHEVRSPLAGDLAAVLASLGHRSASRAG